jgi:hypothetical protein
MWPKHRKKVKRRRPRTEEKRRIIEWLPQVIGIAIAVLGILGIALTHQNQATEADYPTIVRYSPYIFILGIAIFLIDFIASVVRTTKPNEEASAT